MTNTRKKLIKLLCQATFGVNKQTMESYLIPSAIGEIADHLIAHGVTVHDGKPLEEFLHPIDSYKGLKAKYLVFKADTGKVVDNCFILRPNKDAAAVEALRAYANATDNKTLAEDIYSWVGNGDPVQKWISVKDRLPSKDGCYLVAVTDDYHRRYSKTTWFSCNGGSWFPKQNVTHWMPLPQPPKGE